MTTTTSARDDHWELTDGSLPPEAEAEADSATSPNPTRLAAERPLFEDGTTVTEGTHDSDRFGSVMEEDDEKYQEEDDGKSEISSFGYANANGVPAEVSYRENVNDATRQDDDGSDSNPSDAESDDEPDDAKDESEEELDGESADRDDSADEYETDEYETDEDSVESERSAESDGDGPMDGSSCSGAPSRTGRGGGSPTSQHELFLPWDVSPSTQSLKYEEASDDDSSDEEDAGECFRHRTYMIGSGRSGRPRMWDGCPCGVSVSSDSGSSVGSSQGSKSSSQSGGRRKAGVSFSDAVTVYPVYETSAYPTSVVKSMYTKREELRVNKLRAKREFAYDLHDWRNATEEEEMEANEDGELVHPVHAEGSGAAPPAPAPQAACRTGNIVRTYSSALGGYTMDGVGSGVVHRAKRMRMYYP